MDYNPRIAVVIPEGRCVSHGYNERNSESSIQSLDDVLARE